MISKAQHQEAYVWVWLPGATTPVVAGRISRAGDRFLFNYGQSYLERADALSLYLPELPLQAGLINPLPGLSMAGVLRDSAPDAWGRRVVLNRLMGTQARQADIGTVDELTYLLHSGSDHIGALDFQQSPHEYVPRQAPPASLEELLSATERLEQGVTLSPELDQALLHGSSLGGARPKAAVAGEDHQFIAKFSSSNDTYNVVQAEFMAMRLGQAVGLQVAPVHLEKIAGKDVLLIERFDRRWSQKGWQRRAMVSALTLFGLDEMMARYASYSDLAEIIRYRFSQPKKTLKELFARLVFNVLCGNTDDHARNHAAFWDGDGLSLTPAYDICPQMRTGNEATQAMLIHGEDRWSRLTSCLAAAPHFLVDATDAHELIEAQVAGIQAHWNEVAAEANLSAQDRALLANRVFFNPFVFEGAPAKLHGRLT